MKQIQPISIWYNGQMIQAVLFSLISINDNLTNTATFYFQLFSNDSIKLADGNLTMTGFDYQSYSTSIDSNNYAYQWGATQLNLIII